MSLMTLYSWSSLIGSYCRGQSSHGTWWDMCKPNQKITYIYNLQEPTSARTSRSRRGLRRSNLSLNPPTWRLLFSSCFFFCRVWLWQREDLKEAPSLIPSLRPHTGHTVLKHLQIQKQIQIQDKYKYNVHFVFKCLICQSKYKNEKWQNLILQ